MLIFSALMALLVAAGPNSDVEWNGISHYSDFDRNPLCPVQGQAFDVTIKAYQNDLTAVAVRVDNAGVISILNAAKVGIQGPYDIWKATVPASTPTSIIKYRFEVTDTTDTDYYDGVGMHNDAPGGTTDFVVNFATLAHAPIGSTPSTLGGTVFKVWAPTADEAFVRGDFNGGFGGGNPGTALTKVGEHFIGHITNANTGHSYVYRFRTTVQTPNGPQVQETINTDPRARALSASTGYRARIVNPKAYNWVTQNWTTPPLDQLVIYELHVGTFGGLNDPYGFPGLPSKYTDLRVRLPHLKSLGVNCIEIMPVNEFPLGLSAGYNPVSYFAIEAELGTPEEFKALVDRAHGLGIAVVMDVVWNHMSPSDNLLNQFAGAQNYYGTPEQDTPWGWQLNYLNDNVRSYILDSARMWFEEYRIDGFRIDATEYMNIPGSPQEGAGWTLMQALNNQQDNRHAERHMIAEQLPDDNWVTRPVNLGGAGFDAQWYDNFTDRLRENILAASFGDPSMSAIRGIIQGSGQYLENQSVVTYLELHDEVWPTSGGQRIVKTIDNTPPHDDQYAKGRTKLGQGLVMTAPGVPTMLYGSEWLEDTDFGAGNDFGDNRIDWSHLTTYAGIFEYYKDLIHIRRENGALFANSPRQVFHVNDVGNVIAFQRYNFAGNVMVIVANFSNTDYTSYDLGFPQPGAWYQLLNSEAIKYMGDGPNNPTQINTTPTARDGHPQSATIAVPAHGILIFRHNVPPPPECSSDFNNSGGTDADDIFAFLDAWFVQTGQVVSGLTADFDGNQTVSADDIFAFLDVWFVQNGQCP